MSEFIDNEVLISLVRERPALWDKTLEIYKDRCATERGWREVCREIRADFENLEEKERKCFGKEVLKRWKNLRDAFKKRERDSKTLGVQASKKKKYIFYNQLQFLKKILDKTETSEKSTSTTEENKIETDKSCQQPPEGIGCEGLAMGTKGNISNSQSKSKHKKTDDIDLRILNALEKCIPEKPNAQMAFFYSLLPHTQGFDANQWLQFQMEVFQIICNIKVQKAAVTNRQGNLTQFTPQFQQQSQNYSQPLAFPFQQTFTTPSTLNQSQPPSWNPFVATEPLPISSYQTRQSVPTYPSQALYLSTASPLQEPSPSLPIKNKAKETIAFIKEEIEIMSDDSSNTKDITF